MGRTALCLTRELLLACLKVPADVIVTGVAYEPEVDSVILYVDDPRAPSVPEGSMSPRGAQPEGQDATP